MANPDRPGFRPVRSKYGLTSWDLSFAEPCLVDDALFDTESSAIAVGTPLMYTSTENALSGGDGDILGHLRMVVPLTDEEVTPAETMAATAVERVAGVCVGITKVGSGNTTFNDPLGQFFGDPTDLNTPTGKYVTSAEVEADPNGVIIWIAEAREWLYEAQIETAGSPQPGDGYDVTTIDDGADEIVDTTTGLSKATLTAEATDPRFIVTHLPRYQDNDFEAADARVWVAVPEVFTLLTATGLGTID